MSKSFALESMQGIKLFEYRLLNDFQKIKHSIINYFVTILISFFRYSATFDFPIPAVLKIITTKSFLF